MRAGTELMTNATPMTKGKPGTAPRLSLRHWWGIGRDSSFPRRASASDGARFPREAGEHGGAVVRHQHVVLDPHTAPAGDVHAGLDGHDHARLQHVLRVGTDARGLVNLQP